MESLTRWVHSELGSPTVWILIFHGLAAASAYSLMSNTVFGLASTWRYTVALFLQMVGLSYTLAFWSMYQQIVGLIGPEGILPMRDHLRDRQKTLLWRIARSGKTLRCDVEWGREMLGSKFHARHPKEQRMVLKRILGATAREEEIDLLLQPITLLDMLLQVVHDKLAVATFFEQLQFRYVTFSIASELRTWSALGTSDKDLRSVCILGACCSFGLFLAPLRLFSWVQPIQPVLLAACWWLYLVVKRATREVYRVFLASTFPTASLSHHTSC
jgi:hypothetical protein